MTSRTTELFTPVVEERKLHSSFVKTLTPPSMAAKGMLSEVFAQFTDPDGNFVEQFQTSGFDARLFELYLFAHFSRSGYTVTRPKPAPDFIVARDGVEVAVEATTANPSTSRAAGGRTTHLWEMTRAEAQEYQSHGMAIRLGSPLFSKLNKRYWDFAHCKGKPFVLAIENFHEEGSLAFADSGLSDYLYGIEQTAHWLPDGTLVVEANERTAHTAGAKTIPSNFFAQPGAENISAVLFTNSGTHAKFSRMGYQAGHDRGELVMWREGLCYSHGGTLRDPTWFRYDLAAPPRLETWGEGTVVIHNPRAKYPVPPGFFLDAVESRYEDGVVVSTVPPWHPFTSHTFIFPVGAAEQSALRPVQIRPLTRLEFDLKSAFVFTFDNPVFEQDGWFADPSDTVLGLVAQDRCDQDWAYAVLTRGSDGRFGASSTQINLPDRLTAVRQLQMEMAGGSIAAVLSAVLDEIVKGHSARGRTATKRKARKRGRRRR